MHNGELEMSLRYTVQRGLVNMISEFSEGEIDAATLLTQADLVIPGFEDLSVETTSIDNAYSVGFELRMQTKLNNLLT